MGTGTDLSRTTKSRGNRKGQGKFRNRAKVVSKGPMLIYNNDQGISLAVRNLVGVESGLVKNLNLINLAPGGHLGRFLIWTRTALEALDCIWGSPTISSSYKIGYELPHALVKNPYFNQLTHNNEIQTIINMSKTTFIDKHYNTGKCCNDPAGITKLCRPKYKIDRGKTKPQKIKTNYVDSQPVEYGSYRGKTFEAFQNWLGLSGHV